MTWNSKVMNHTNGYAGTTKKTYCSFSISRPILSNKFKFVNKLYLNNKLSSDINAIIGLDTGQALSIPLLHPTKRIISAFQ